MAKTILFFLSSFVFNSLQAQERTRGDSTEVHIVIEHSPEFPGGYKALMGFIRENLRIPANDRDFIEVGPVYTTFVIDEKGNVRDIKILRGGSKEIDEEVIRLLQSMPVWKPGTQNGKKAKVQISLPIRFAK